MDRTNGFRIAAMCFGIMFFAVSLFATELRIDNEVRPGDVKSTTYLINGNFYSLIGQNGEITFYDATKKTFSILDPSLRIQARLDAGETKERVELLRRQILESPRLEPGTFNAFVVKPVFQSEFDAGSGDLALRSTWFDYVMETTAFPGEQAAKLYAEFCDLSCYLNFRISKSPSMIVRLEVNRILAAQKRFPSKMSVSIFPHGQGPLAKVEKAESSHKIVLRLTAEDRQRIAGVDESMRTFTVVPFSEYEMKVAEKKETGKK